jgi:predicted enzyme related to lactoylglutathione lyase
MQISLAWYNVKDLAQAKKFYGEVLGLKKTFEMPGWAEFSHAEGAVSIGLGEGRGESGTGGATVVLRVPDLDRARKELGGRGVKFEEPVEEIPGMVRIGTFHDPFGNRLQLVQVLMQK